MEFQMNRCKCEVRLIFLIIISLGISYPAQNPNLQGNIKDVKTGEPLIGANIVILGTSMGAASRNDGKYFISNINPGSYTIKVSYIGYRTDSVKVVINENENKVQDFKLVPEGIESQTVVVTSQATGQVEAINKELSSDLIENVVSSEKIKELPDVNAAESIGRLPGVTVVRNAGEGYQVSIRGLQPKYNEITIDGVKMGSSDPNNRSADLSMISSDMLEGIEVQKSVTPDLDANVIGGIVNFDMREAKVIVPGRPVFNLSLQGGYKNLPDAVDKYNNYKYVVSGEDRLFDDNFGIFAQLEIDRRNLTSNQLSASYDQLHNNTIDHKTTALGLFYLPRDRQRSNLALNLDYKIPDGKIKFINFASSSKTSSFQADNNFLINNSAQSYILSNNSNTVNNIINSIDFEKQFDFFHIDGKLSHTYSETINPGNWAVNFTQGSQGIAQFIDQANVNPQNIPKFGNYDFSSAFLSTVTADHSFSRQRTLSASLDLSKNINFSEDVTTTLKFGGIFEHKYKWYVYDQNNSEPLNEPGDIFLDNLITSYFSIPINSYNLPLSYFIDPHFSFGKFLGGDYSMVAPINRDMMIRMVNLLQNNIQNLAANNHAYSFFHNDYASRTNNYSGYENHGAFYGMVNANIGPQINIITGVRFQNLQTNYTATRGIFTTSGFASYYHYDTTVIQNHGYWLPDLTVRYRPLPWFDVRLAYSNTLAYPDYNSIIPRIDMNGIVINWVNYKLIPSRSYNYDAYLSFYNNTIGLFTTGLFLKRIVNLIYPWSFFVSGANVVPYLPTGVVTSYNPNGSYNIITYLNDSYRINDYGIEFDWQTHFWYLPAPLSGFVLGLNYTHIFSKAQYPYTFVEATGRALKFIDTTFTDRLLDQPSNVINLSLGYDYSDFSIRVAFLYQSDIFTGPNFWPQLRTHTPVYRRWDIAAKQKLPWFGLEIFADLNNINSANDLSIIYGGSVPEAQQDYGFTADVGFRIKL
jgi:TonB-dependent receptor